MLLEISIPFFIGIIIGTITGITPGIHINLVCSLLLVFYATISQYLGKLQLAIFIVSMSITHMFLEFIPSLVFGVPSSETALSTLPGHRLLLDGKGLSAIKLSAIGSFLGIILATFLAPILYFLLRYYKYIEIIIPYILIFTILILIITEKNKNTTFWAIIIVLLSGGIGFLILNSNYIKEPLLVLFTGLFGISSLLISLNDKHSKIPPQEKSSKEKLNKKTFKAIGIGGIASTICSVIPGIGSSQAGTLSTLFIKKIESKIFLIVSSSINTINFIIAIITLSVINRSRNGSIVAISQILDSFKMYQMIFLIIISILAGIFAYYLTIFLGKKVLFTIEKINIKKFNIVLIVLLLIFVYIISGPIAIIALLCCSALGILCIVLDVKRVHLMSCLLIPLIFGLL